MWSNRDESQCECSECRLYNRTCPHTLVIQPPRIPSNDIICRKKRYTLYPKIKKPSLVENTLENTLENTIETTVESTVESTIESTIESRTENTLEKGIRKGIRKVY